MTNAISVLRGLLIYSVCVPLAIFLGYMLATPLDPGTFITVGLVLAILLLPILLRWHHHLLVFAWNTTTVVFVLPGRPNIWMLLAGLSLIFTMLHYVLTRRGALQNVPSITRPLIFFGIVLVVTALMTGGAGFMALGSEVGGGKRYVALFAAIIGYFALSVRRIPLEKAHLFIGLFFLSGLTLAIGSVAPFVSKDLHFLFLLFPVDSAAFISASENLGVVRWWGIALACIFAMTFMLGRFGIRGMFSGQHPWRLLIFLALWAGSLYGGYRSFFLITLTLFCVQFYLEGLHRTGLMAVLAGLGFAAAVVALPFASSLPYSVQRAVSVLPGIQVLPEVRIDTANSTEWRVRMWQQVAPEIPHHLMLGKGYGISVHDLEMTRDLMMARRLHETTHGAQLAQDYHNGPLSVIIPLGIWGVIAVLWFWFAAFRLLHANYRYGAPELRTVNTLLLALFITKVLNFLIVFGNLYNEFFQFTGIVGLSVALNGGLARKPVPVRAEITPAPRKPKFPLLPRPRPAFDR